MRKIAIYGFVGLVVLTVLIGLAHTPSGLRAIAWVTGSEGCPFGGDGKALTATAVEKLRLDELARRGASKELAPARPALGFALDRDRRDEVVRWAAETGLRCDADRSGAGLRCQDVRLATLPSPSAVATTARGVISFGFDPAGALVSVQLQSATGTPHRVIAQLAGAAMAQLEAVQGGAVTGDALDSPTFVHRRARVVFADYYAEVTAANLGRHWMMIESYQSPGKSPAVSTTTAAAGSVAAR